MPGYLSVSIVPHYSQRPTTVRMYILKQKHVTACSKRQSNPQFPVQCLSISAKHLFCKSFRKGTKMGFQGIMCGPIMSTPKTNYKKLHRNRHSGSTLRQKSITPATLPGYGNKGNTAFSPRVRACVCVCVCVCVLSLIHISEPTRPP